MDDRVLRQIITDELEFEPSIEAACIGVAVENGVATLTGHVGSYAEKLAVERAVQRIRGVRAIVEELEIRYRDDERTADDQIAARALNILDQDTQVPRNGIKIKVHQGWVTLTGIVNRQYQREAADWAVRRLSGVTGVTNLVEVKPKVEATDVKQKIMDALQHNAELETHAIRVTVADGRVILEGKVRAWYERELATRAAWSAPGVAAVEDRLTLG